MAGCLPPLVGLEYFLFTLNKASPGITDTLQLRSRMCNPGGQSEVACVHSGQGKGGCIRTGLARKAQAPSTFLWAGALSAGLRALA